MRQILKAGTIVLVVALLATTGVALAQSGEDVSGDIRHDWLMERLGDLVERGVIDEDQAEQIADHLLEEPLGPRFDGVHPMGRIPRIGALEDVAGFLGMDAEELLERVRAGESLGEIAGDGAEELADFLLAELEEHLDEMVDAGRLGEEHKSEILQEASERIDALMDGEWTGRLPGPGIGPDGFLGGPGFHDRGFHHRGFPGPCEQSGEDAGIVEGSST